MNAYFLLLKFRLRTFIEKFQFWRRVHNTRQCKSCCLWGTFYTFCHDDDELRHLLEV